MTGETFTISKIAHEIRNPLTLITSSLQFIESSHPEVKSFLYWNETMEDVAYLSTLLADLSSYNHSEQLHASPLDLKSLLQSVMDFFRPSLEKANVQIHVTNLEPLPTVLGDAIKLKECLINILKNALEAVSENGSIEVAAFPSSDTQMVQLQIRDDGCGMNAEQLQTLFTPFVTTKENGTGLGLSISKRIIEAHGGTIEAISAPGQGTVFTILLPSIL